MGLQELLIHFHPVFVVVVFPLTILAGCVCMPFLKPTDNHSGTWFISDRGKKAGKQSAFAGILFTVVFILVSEILPDPETLLPSVPSFILTGLVPFIIVAGPIFMFMKFIRKRYSINRAEYIQTLIILLVVSYAVLSLVGILFRGQGMKLMWPWQI
jgi:hypothetical protein